MNFIYSARKIKLNMYASFLKFSVCEMLICINIPLACWQICNFIVPCMKFYHSFLKDNALDTNNARPGPGRLAELTVMLPP